MNETYTKLRNFALKRLRNSQESEHLHYWHGYLGGLSALRKELFRTEEALEKQIPKKPMNEECYYICPCCRGDLGVSDDDIFIYELSMPKYCSNCGCALDWSEVDE